MLYESCTNIFLFRSHINFNILTHFLNANFEKSLHGCRVCPTCKRKLLLIIKANAKKLGIFFLFSFFSDWPILQILKKIRAPGLALCIIFLPINFLLFFPLQAYVKHHFSLNTLPPGAPLRYFNDGRGGGLTEVHILYPKKTQLQNCLPKKNEEKYNTQKIPVFFL